MQIAVPAGNPNSSVSIPKSMPPSPAVHAAPSHLLAVWPDLWQRVLDHFGKQGLYWFRDSPLVSHWKNISNPKAWDFLIFEYLFFVKGKGKKLNTFPPSFNPVSQEGWEDFVGKPYIGQGTRYFRRDLRNFIKTGASAGILRNIKKDDIPSHVLLSIKQILAFEQSLNMDKFAKLGLLDPPTDFDPQELVKEADRRIQLIKGFFVSELEESGQFKWLDGDDAQHLRKGQVMLQEGGQDVELPLDTIEKPIIESPTSSDPNTTELKRKVSSESCLPLKKRMMAVHATSHASASDSCPSTPLLSSSSSVTASPKEEEDSKAFNAPSLDMSVADVLSLLCKEHITIDVKTKNGKSIAKNLCISSVYTFAELLSILPLPELDKSQQECYWCSKEGLDASAESVFLQQDRIGLYVQSGDVVVISKGKETSLDVQDF